MHPAEDAVVQDQPIMGEGSTWDVCDYFWDPIRGLALKQVDDQVLSHPLSIDKRSSRDVGVAPIHWGPLPRGPLLCQVADCGKDLTEEKAYYQRHRVW